MRSTTGSVDEFMRRENAGRDLLGRALRSSWDWAVRGWILAISPYSYPVKANYAKWNTGNTSQCACGKDAESFTHLQLGCLLEFRRQARQAAHNRVAKVVEKHLDKVNTQQRISVWDKQVSNFLQLIESTRPHAALLNSLTLQDLKAWQDMVRSPRPTRLVGQKRTIEDIQTYFEKEDLGKRPDGLVFDLQARTIYLIEVARTGDAEGSLRNRYIKKTLKYSPLAEAFRQAFNPCTVEQTTLVIGLLGSIEESRWRQSLSAFGMTQSQQDKLISKCMVATIEGTHSVLGAADQSK